MRSPELVRRPGNDVDEVLAYIWPTHREDVHFYGTRRLDIDGELDADGQRSLRSGSFSRLIVLARRTSPAFRCAPLA